MTERERLIELLLSSAPHFDGSESPETIKMLSTPVEEVVDYLLANGVKIPVKCEECVYHHWCQEPSHGKTEHYCGLPYMGGIGVFKGYFCYYGERKTDNG